MLRAEEAYALDGQDISRFLNEKVTIVAYDELRPIQSLLEKYNRFALLYVFPGKKVGHWVCGFLRQGKLHLFDPYGLNPDEPMKMMQHPEIKTYSRLIQQSPYYPDRIVINATRYQKFADKVDTCGRHVLARLLFDEYDDAEYRKVMKGPMETNADSRATLMTLVIGLHKNK